MNSKVYCINTCSFYCMKAVPECDPKGLLKLCRAGRVLKPSHINNASLSVGRFNTFLPQIMYSSFTTYPFRLSPAHGCSIF